MFGGLGGCAHCNLSIVIPLVIANEKNNLKEKIIIEARVLEGSPFNLIIGLPDIKHFSLTKKYLSHFEENKILFILNNIIRG